MTFSLAVFLEKTWKRLYDSVDQRQAIRYFTIFCTAFIVVYIIGLVFS